MSRPARLGLILLPLVAAVAVGGWLLYQRWQGQHQPQTAPPDGTEQAAAGKPGPKLVVLAVFDQMRGDYLDRWAGQFGPDGFERMKKDGVWYSNCHLPYACSSTGPGHASIATGAPPSVHGVIENEWYDRAAAARVYCVQPPRPYDRVPPLPPGSGKPGRGAETGFSPDRLLAETVADRLHAATGGKGRAFSLSLKDRTAVLMGGKQPAGVYCFDTRDGIFHTGAFYRDRVHPWVEEFNTANPRKADEWFGKAWEPLRSKEECDKLAGPDDAPGEAPGFAGQGRVFPHPFPPRSTDPAGNKGYYSAVECSPFGNELLLELAKKAVVAENLGKGEAPDLLCVSFSSNDIVGHQWGPDSWEVFDVTVRTDRLIADLLKFLDGTVGRDRYVLVVTADHGVCPIPEQKRYPDLYPAATRTPVVELLQTLTAALDAVHGKSPGGPTRWLEVEDKEVELVWPWVYLNRPAIRARGLDPDAVAEYAAQWVGGRPYMLAGFTRKQIESGTLPPTGPFSEREVRAAFEKVRLAYHRDRCGDVIAVPRAGVQVTGYKEGTGHGTPNAHDTHVPVLVYGAGVPALGKRTEPKSSLVVAPTLAWALGIDPPSTAAEKVPAEMGGSVAR